MAILLISPGREVEWLKGLHAIDSTLDIRVWPEVGNPNDIEFALLWRYPHGELLKYPNLKAISSLGAGVDHIMSDPNLPKNIPILRVIDKLLVRDMTQYIAMAVLQHVRQLDLYQEQQLQKKWLWHGFASDIKIGIMGMGELGSDAANKLYHLDFAVQGWSRTPKELVGIKTFYGAEGQVEFLKTTTILVNLLPLTPQTKNILNKKLFYQMPRGAYIINVARGGHVVDEDLIAAIDAGQLSGACLDVFREEPLPESHPFWGHPKIIVTPHIASVTNPKSVAEQLVLNYRNAIAGKPLMNIVDVSLGY